MSRTNTFKGNGFSAINGMLDLLSPLAAGLLPPIPTTYQPNDPSVATFLEEEADGSEASQEDNTSVVVDSDKWTKYFPNFDAFSSPRSFRASKPVPVLACDCGMARLGETATGTLIALRAALTLDTDWNTRVRLFRTGPINLEGERKTDVLHRMGADMGDAEFFVCWEGEGENARLAPKSGAAAHRQIYADRVRNYLERMVQLAALTSVPPRGSILLVDGSLTTRSYDTAPAWWQEFSGLADTHGIHLVGISKKSVLAIRDRPVAFWLEDVPAQICRRNLTPILRADSPARADRVLGEIFAVRFSPCGPTLRVDVRAAGGTDAETVLDLLLASCDFRGGLAEPLVRAHAHSYFTSSAVRVLQAQAAVTYNLVPTRTSADGAAVYGFAAGRYK